MRKLRFFNSSNVIKPAKKGSSARIIPQVQRIDFILLVSVILISLFGLLMVYDASQFEAFQDFGDKYYYIKQQVISVIVGFGALGFMFFFDYHKLQKLALPAFLITLVLLLLVFVPGLGVMAGGAHRWLRFPGFSLQPAELIKLTSVFLFALYFQKKASVLPFLVILGLITFIVGVLQKDLGSAVVFCLTLFGVYFASGASIMKFILMVPVGLISAIGFVLSSAYRKQRVLAFIDPFADPQGYSYHISQVLIAIGSGGLFGVGIGQSRQKFSYIPEVTTDSIFSVVGEELGLFGSLILICLLGFIVLRGFRIAETAPDTFGKLLASGLTIWLGVQAAVNLAAMVSLIPLTGVPLPFISFGGTAMVVNLIAVGILLNISKQADIK